MAPILAFSSAFKRSARAAGNSDIAEFAVVDLNNGVFGDESGEGFEFYIEDSSVPYEFTISSGLAGLGETDTCVFFDGGDRCAGGLFQVVKTVESNNGSTQVSEPASFATAMLILQQNFLLLNLPAIL